MKLLVIAVILGSFKTGSFFEVLLNGEATTRTKFCIGDTITLVCDGSTSSYAWQIPDAGIDQSDLTVTPGNKMRTEEGFTATYIADNETTLEFTATASINESEILCVDFVNNINLTTTVFTLHAFPAAPTVDISSYSNLTSLSIRISSSDPDSICVDQYNISLTGDDQSLFAMVPKNDSAIYDAHTLFNTTLLLCIDLYSLTVQSSSGGGVAMSAIYYPPAAPTIVISLDEDLTSFDIQISSDDPTSICVDQYNVSLRNNEISLFAVVPSGDNIFDASTLFNDTFEICKVSYELTVVASIGGDSANTTVDSSHEGCRSSTTENSETTMTTQDSYRNRYQAALGAAIGVSVAAVVVIIPLSGVIVALFVYIKVLKSKTSVVYPSGAHQMIKVDTKM